MDVQIYSTHYMKQYLMKCLLKYITFLKKEKKNKKSVLQTSICIHTRAIGLSY